VIVFDVVPHAGQQSFSAVTATKLQMFDAAFVSNPLDSD
jgi:hypothetical protein